MYQHQFITEIKKKTDKQVKSNVKYVLYNSKYMKINRNNVITAQC